MILILGITDYFYVALQLCLFAIIQYPIMDNPFCLEPWTVLNLTSNFSYLRSRRFVTRWQSSRQDDRLESCQ